MKPTYLKSLALALGVLGLVVVFRASHPPADDPVFLAVKGRSVPTVACSRPLAKNRIAHGNVRRRTHAELNDNDRGNLFKYAQTRP